MPKWKCKFCNYVFVSEERPTVCPFCHRKSEMEIFSNSFFAETEMD
jgi:rubrerythrin